jgi:hypothetical protein
MKTIQTKCAVLASIAGLVLACGGVNGPAATGTPQSPGVANAQGGAQGDAAIVERLAEARCDREQACNHIGPGAVYASRGVCKEQVHGSIANDLNTYNCPRGLDGEAIDRCMAAIKGEECGHPFDTLVRYEKCRNAALCMK